MKDRFRKSRIDHRTTVLFGNGSRVVVGTVEGFPTSVRASSCDLLSEFAREAARIYAQSSEFYFMYLAPKITGKVKPFKSTPPLTANPFLRVMEESEI